MAPAGETTGHHGIRTCTGRVKQLTLESSVTVPEKNRYAAGEIGHGYIEIPILIEIPRRYRDGLATGRVGGLGREAAIARAQQDGNSVVGVVSHRQIRYAVPVEVAHCD